MLHVVRGFEPTKCSSTRGLVADHLQRYLDLLPSSVRGPKGHGLGPSALADVGLHLQCSTTLSESIPATDRRPYKLE